MTRHILARTVLLALTALPIAANAAPFHLFSSTNAAHPKMIHFKLHNSSTVAREVKIGDQVISFAPGQLRDMSAPVGTTVYSSGKSETHADGDRIVEITPNMSGAVCSFS